MKGFLLKTIDAAIHLLMRFQEWLCKKDYEAAKITHAVYNPHEMEIYVKHPAIPALSAALVEFFEDVGGENYVEWTVWGPPPRGLYVITIARKDGKSQGEIIAELKKEVERLKRGGLEALMVDT